MTSPAEKVCWLALLSDPQVDRAQAKAALHRWAVLEQRRVCELAGLGPVALSERLPELVAQQAAAWANALRRADAAERTLQVWSQQGVDVMLRTDAAYPENWVRRLNERWLPYVLFWRGTLELLTVPAVQIAGATAPSSEAAALARELATRLAQGSLALVGGYGQGVDRLALTAGAHAAVPTVVILPVGLAHAEPILRAGQEAVAAGRRLELSPFAPETAYQPALGRARDRLVAAMAEVLVLIEPEVGPADWPALEALLADGARVLIWEGGDRSRCAAWQAAGGLAFADAAACARLVDACLAAPLESACDDGAAIGPDDGPPVRFADAASAIQRLSETGRVPEKLARRLREAEERGWLGDG